MVSEEELQELRRKAEAYDKIVSKNSAAGKASVAKLSKAELSERNKKAAAARWGK